MGVLSLILGIFSIVAAFVPGFSWIGAVLGLAGIVFGAIGRLFPFSRGLATGGLVCSIIGFVFSTVFFVTCLACTGQLDNVFDRFT